MSSSKCPLTPTSVDPVKSYVLPSSSKKKSRVRMRWCGSACKLLSEDWVAVLVDDALVLWCSSSEVDKNPSRSGRPLSSLGGIIEGIMDVDWISGGECFVVALKDKPYLQIYTATRTWQKRGLLGRQASF